MFCSRCGLRVDEGGRFCQACGQEVAGSAPAAPLAASATPPPTAVSAPVSAPLPYAGFWIRLAAYFIDGVILGIPFGLVVIILMFLLGGFGLMMRRNPVDPRAAAALAGPLILGLLLGMLFFVGLQWLYFAGMESSERQATFGKAAMSLRVTDLEGRRLSFWARHRAILCEDRQRTDPARDWLHHGRIHGKEAGAPRHDRRDAGSPKIVISPATVALIPVLRL